LDREILKAAFRKEHALLTNLEAYGYQYIDHFAPSTALLVHTICVEMRAAAAAGAIASPRAAFGPTPFAILQEHGLLKKDTSDLKAQHDKGTLHFFESRPIHELTNITVGEFPKPSKEVSSHSGNTSLRKGHQKSKSTDLYERSLEGPNVGTASVSSNDSNLSNSLLNRWGGTYGYNVLPQVLLGENERPTTSLLRFVHR